MDVDSECANIHLFDKLESNTKYQLHPGVLVMQAKAIRGWRNRMGDLASTHNSETNLLINFALFYENLTFAIQQQVQQNRAKSGGTDATQCEVAKFQGEITSAQHQRDGGDQQVFVV